MCTVSVIVLEGARPGIRVVCNRDEQRDRPPASQPRQRVLDAPRGSLRAWWPTDSEAGGTWIGASEAGVVLCLLNRNPEPPRPLPPPLALRSRGLIIPELIHLPTAAEVGAAAGALDLDRFAPFRLIAIDCQGASAQRGPFQPRVVEACWDRRDFSVETIERSPACFVSSGLGDSEVAPRLDLFAKLVAPGPGAALGQDRFHLHSWPKRPEISVLMSREDARTVSITVVEVLLDPAREGGCEVRMSYRPVGSGAASMPAAVAR